MLKNKKHTELTIEYKTLLTSVVPSSDMVSRPTNGYAAHDTFA
jgi:hypothetical protein